MKVLSGKQPWWWAILHAGKRVENRLPSSPVAKTKHRGTVLLHASAGFTKAYYHEAIAWMLERELVRHPHAAILLAGMQSEQTNPGFYSEVIYGQTTPTKPVNRGPRPPMLPAAKDLLTGGIIGRARIRDIVWPEASDKEIAAVHGVDVRWRMAGQYALILEEVEPLPFTPCKGHLGLWNAPAELLDRLGIREAA